MDAKRFEVFVEDVSQEDGHVLVKVDYGAVCKADIRYYLGGRDSKVLGLKYPLSLIHEAMGTVLRDRTGKFAQGDRVVFVPNIARYTEVCPMKLERDELTCSGLLRDSQSSSVLSDNKRAINSGDALCGDCRCLREDLGENFCPNAAFASSNYDGFSKDIVSYPRDNLVRLNGSEPCFVFSELISVALAALRRVCLDKDSRVAVYGNGVMGYILSAVIREMYDCYVFAVGRHMDKLEKFSMCDGVVEIDDVKKKLPRFDNAFECVGGVAAAGAINSAIDLISPGGDIVLMGVSEEAVPLDTRMILQKGLTLKGTTRSNKADFERAVSLFGNSVFKERIEMLVLDEINIKCIDDYYRAFEAECANKRFGKYILAF